MPLDFRILTTFPDHPKTRRLIRSHGEAAAFQLIRLWAWVREERPDGVLRALADDDVEDLAGWKGETGAFVSALLRPLVDGGHGFLERGPDGVLICHDWADHNPYSAGEADRRELARSLGRAGGLASAEARRKRPGPSENRSGSYIEEGGDEKARNAATRSASEAVQFQDEKKREIPSSENEAVSRVGQPPSPSPSPSPSPFPSPLPSPASEGVEASGGGIGNSGFVEAPLASDSPPDGIGSPEQEPQQDPDGAALDASAAARLKASGWLLHVRGKSKQLAGLAKRIRPLGTYRDSGLPVYAAASKSDRTAFKLELQRIGGSELSRQVVVWVESKQASDVVTESVTTR